MLRSTRHIARLIGIGRTLARHRALEPLEKADIPRPFLWLLRLLGGRGRPVAGKRPGERLAAALHELGPSFIKLGQALSVRADLLGEEIASDLGSLRDRLPPYPAEIVRSAIESELGKPVSALYIDFSDRPVAAASIAQVHFATVADPETGETNEVAVKVLRPGVEAAFRRDLALFRWLAHQLVRFVPDARRLRPVEVVETLAASVEIEMDLRLEAAAASELAENFADDPNYRVPTIDWERTGRRVMTMQRVQGLGIGDRDALAEAGHDLPAIATNVIRVFLLQALRDGLFHADMHQGNLFVGEDGAFIPVDFGIMGRIDRRTRLFLAEMLHAFLQGDYRRAAEVHFEAGYVPASQSVEIFAQACRSIGEPIRGKPVSQISIARLLLQLFRVTETFAMETQPQLLLLQKTMVTAEGVARGLDPDVNFWEAAEPVIVRWSEDNLGPEGRLRDAGDAGARLLRRLPALADEAERTLAALVASRNGPTTEKSEAAALARLDRGRWQRALVIAAAILVLAVSIAVG
ncbi:2-polyprenylphenol 6-hydroxylase [Oceanibacterium hippocampi]|uniref:ABC1 atypical kinase-like domain-containing protein n=1 Tax=Oceanibacterium hippocampi TaxID=745714 RepID=A0A1Y5RNL7_9PROT|nr:2-polyprenylphenol 6-hydroxylase [Oceanibacterium hippocampi]SLN21757.1 putative protein kinase UbiB [Oceanibacterium hippocampi]